MKKYLIAALLLLLCTFTLSCNTNTEKPIDEGEHTPLVVDGVPLYKIVRSDFSDNPTASMKLIATLEEHTGIDFIIETDWVSRGKEIPSDTYEILVGNTNRTESVVAARTLRNNDYTIIFKNNRIVILGGNDETTLQAVDCFIERYCNTTGEITIPVDYRIDFNSVYDIERTALVDYSIVYTKDLNAHNVASSLHDIILSLSGYNLPILREDEPAANKRIIVGIGDSVKIDGNDILIGGSTPLELVDSAVYYISNGLEKDIFDEFSPDTTIHSNFEVTPYGIRISNEHAVYFISRSCNFSNLFDKSNGNDITDTLLYFCTLDTPDGTVVNPSSVTADTNGIMTFKMSDDYEIEFQTTIYDDFISFELLTDISDKYISCSFANMKLQYELAEHTFASTGYAMTINTNQVFFPSGEDKAIRAECFTQIGTKGAKLAIISADYSLHRDILKEVNEVILSDRSNPLAIQISSTGGANALDNKELRGDYVIIGDSEPKSVQSWIDFYTAYDVDQLDFHQGGSTFRQGDFIFHKTGDALGFNKKVATPLREAGIISGLHSYSFYIDYNASTILSDPKCQTDLEVMETFTLASDLSKTDTSVITNESTDDVSDYYGFFSHNTPFLLIDNEIIRIVVDKQGFINCQRGQCGTVAAEHKAGTEIKHIGGYYGMIAPIPGSELFYQIARNTAKAYNEGGFGMIYLDALDGIGVHTKNNDTKNLTWYYTASFVNEILKYADTDPIMEYSMIPPNIWFARGRGGAWDTPARGYKEWNKLHIASNASLISKYYTTTLGWYNFYPMQAGYPGNFSVKYKFTDDVDQMGSIAIAYNNSVVYNGLTEAGLNNTPALKRNMDRYLVYNKLRKSDYFGDEIKKQIREGKYEYQLIEDKDGEYNFYEKKYIKGKINGESNLVSGNNPFANQKPFIRIEGLLSSIGKDPVTLLELDENKPLISQTLETEFDELNIKDKLAIKVRVYGNNSDDAICIRLSGATESEKGVSDYLIKLNFEGWRDIILAEIDNGDFNDISFEKPNGFYDFYRASVNYDRITSVNVYTHGNCEGVKMGNIQAVCHIKNTIINPSVTISGETIKFICKLDSTEYLEYDGINAVIYDSIGKSSPVTSVEGVLPTVPNGEFTASLSFENTSVADAPLRATLTFGLTGNIIK